MKPKLVAALGGALLAIGSLLPWATISLGVATRSINGTEGDGIITLIVGALILLAGLGAKETPGSRGSAIAALLGLLSFLFMFYKMLTLTSAVSSAASGLLSASIGTGIWVCLIGSVIAFAGGMSRNPAAPVSMPPTQSQIQ